MGDCPFCARIRDGRDLTASAGAAVAFADQFPVSDGHTLIVPRRHVSDRALDSDKKSGKRTIAQLDRLMATLDGIVERPEPTESRPVYDQFNLAMAVRAATENFQRSWRARLGLTTSPTTAKEHWTRVKALSRRLAVMRQDEYSTLRPVADLREQLVEQIYVAVQSPVRWEGGDLSDHEKQAAFDRLAHVVSRRMTDLAARRVWGDRMQEWQRANALHGAGSTFVRARLIADEVYAPGGADPGAGPDTGPKPVLARGRNGPQGSG